MNRLLESLIYLLVVLLFLIMIAAMMIFIVSVSSNMDQDNECEDMEDYGYVIVLEEYRFVLTCYIIMEDGVRIKSNDYVISDNRRPRMTIKQSDVLTRKSAQ